MASPSHRSSASMSTTNLVPPGGAPQQQRRMSLPPPPSPLNLPEPVYGNRRPPSPLRNGFAIDPRTGEVSDSSSTHPSEESSNHAQWGQRATSPTPSVTQFAANFAQRVGSLMSNMSSRSALPTDEELEAEAERERERSRREAERILAREAEERRTVEQRVMAMLNEQEALRPPPARSQTMPVTPPSPSSSQKEASWWSTAKQKLTPTKELTPAQQIIQDTKARDKEMEKEKKKIEKQEKKQKGKEWPTTPERKFDDPAFIKLGMAASPGRPVSSSPSSPSPLPRGVSSIPPSLAPSPMRGGESELENGASPSRVPPPLYAQFNAQGALDIAGTLLTITKRFEKLEKWTVSHVRALEERMDDVERWLVEKEREKEETQGGGVPDSALNEVREEMAELQGRIGELGREMAKMVIAPGNLSSGPGRNAPTVGRAPSTSSSVAVQSISRNVTSPPRSTPPRVQGTTSPTTTTPVPSNSRASRTRLPYPTGDYASPPDSTMLGQGPFSPTSSPPASLTAASKARHMSVSGLPSQDFDTFSVGNSPSGLPNNKATNGGTSPGALPAPNPPAWRPSSASPTPRKRYTVALGTHIMARSGSDREDGGSRPTTPHSHSRSQSRELGTAFFSTSPSSTSSALEDPHGTQSADESDDPGEETIGKHSGRHISAGLAAPSNATSPSTSPSPSPGRNHGAHATNTHTNTNTNTTTNTGAGAGGRRVRPQSMYAPMASQAISAPSPITPLNVRLRSRSTDRFGLGLSDSGTGAQIPPVTPTSGKFVDPLVVRRQATKEAQAGGGPPPPKALVGKQKVPVGDLVAFFQEKA